MYRNTSEFQDKAENFELPFGGKLSQENRWVKLAELIPWQDFEAEYASNFSQNMGAPAKPFRMALGALIIKEKLVTSDEETVEQIKENPYLQYFLGLREYSNEAPFEASMMVHFRKRVNQNLIGRINKKIVVNSREKQTEKQPETKEKDNEESEPLPIKNQGKLIFDATCTPADITYPTDIKLLNQAREDTEKILDRLYEQVRDKLPRKPRTYRQKARKNYLTITKQRRPSRKKRRKAIRKQLAYVRRNLAHIDKLVNQGAKLAQLKSQNYRLLLVVHELFRQQQSMYAARSCRIDNRIVSLNQPHIRPIVRGKAGTPVDFGAKLSVSYIDGFCFLDHLSWDNFNESQDFQLQVELYYQRFGYYPESVHVDRIYRTRANRAFCKQLGIRISAPPLGRPPLNQDPELIQQQLQDERFRNAIEGKFGQAKRRFCLGRIMAKLSSTAESTIAITFLVMNLELLLKQILFVFFRKFGIFTSFKQFFLSFWESTRIFLSFA